MAPEESPTPGILAVAGILLVGLNLRPTVASVPPLLGVIRADLTLSYAAAGLLTTIPTLCMGVFGLGTDAIARRLGRERGVFWAVVLVAFGTLARVWGDVAVVLFATTLVAGVGIAVSQTLLPTLINEYFPGREGAVTGLYTASVTGGAGLASAATAPLRDAVGSWPVALAVWGGFALVALAAWTPVVRNRTATGAGGTSASGLPWRDRWAWVLSLFFGGQATLFVAVLTWLAPLYVDLGWTPTHAGLLLTAFLVGQLVGSLSISTVSDRRPDRRPLFALTLGTAAVGFAAVLVVPLLFPWGWAAMLGLGVGGLFALSLTLPGDYASTPAATSRLTSMVLGVGYLLAAAGPFLIGVLRDALGSYDVAFASLVVLSVALLAVSTRFRPATRLTVE
ncbi:MAG: CynX/NimT family MFS transporter [Haloplanus sp.]